MMTDELRNRLASIISLYIRGDDFETVLMSFDIALSKYDIVEKSTEVVPYQGDVNDLVLKKFMCSKVAKGCSERTIYYYKNTVSKVLQSIGKSYTQITADDIRLYMAIRSQRDKVSKVTINNERRCLSSFFSWLQTEEILLKNPMAKVERVKVTREKKKAFSLMELEKIRAACRTARERAIVETLISTWCRVSELTGIRISDIHDGTCTVHGKGDKVRDVYLNARSVLALETYMKERSDKNPYLFPGAVEGYIQASKGGRCAADWYKDPGLVSETAPLDKGSIESIVRKIGKISGVDHVHPHRFRRTGATMALRAGMPLIQVSKLLGHESIETTQIYLDISDAELEAAHEKYVI